MLGRYLMEGAGGERDHGEGQLWIERATVQGIPDAELELSKLRPIESGDVIKAAIAKPFAVAARSARSSRA